MVAAGLELLTMLGEQIFEVLGERAHTSRHPLVFGKSLPDDKLSQHLRVWMVERN
jgi:hypothetical protein